MSRIYNTLIPYKVLQHDGIEYGVCRSFDHISRYKGLRQVAHIPESSERYVTLETPNPFTTHVEVQYYDVSTNEENRLDLIAQKLLGSATYAWVIAYFNQIEDGFTVHAGQRIVVPRSITALFQTGEILQSIPATQLNLGYE